jgi:hypothetical protein
MEYLDKLLLMVLNVHKFDKLLVVLVHLFVVDIEPLMIQLS